MSFFWSEIDNMKRTASEKYRIFICLLSLCSCLAGLLIWVILQNWFFHSLIWMILFPGCAVLLSWFVLFFFCIDHEFHDDTARLIIR